MTNPISDLKTLFADDLATVNNLILEIANSKDSDLVPLVTKHLQDSGGKRLRPLLTLAFSGFSQKIDSDSNRDGDSDIIPNSTYLAASVELIHAASLLHDDVVDESDMRRGISTANKIWGNKTAILVGDYLFSQAFIFMVRTKNLDALALLSDTSATISEAEVMQIEMIADIDTQIDKYINLVTSKTAVLFAAACRCGVLEHDIQIQDAAYKYGLNLGIAYQIIDDILDYFATSKKFGKSIGNDLKERKMTLPLIFLLSSAPHLRDQISEILNKDHVTNSDVDIIISHLNTHDIASLCGKFATKYLDNASEALKVFRRLNLRIYELLGLLLDSLHNRAH